MTTEFPVLIVGGGPAGLTASLLLSRFGVEHLLVDKRATTGGLPRARGVHARAMEIMRVCGVEADLRRHELDITPGAVWQETLAAPPLREDTAGAAAAPVSPCEGLSISQDVFEDVLRTHARDHDAADLRTGVELVSLDGTDAVLRSAAGVDRVRARYVIAADGARSPIRAGLGIRMAGPDDLGSQRMIAFRADLTPWTGSRPRGIYFLTDHGAALVWTHPDDRWMVSIPAQLDTVDSPEETVRRVLGLPDLAPEILGSGPWTAAAQTATAYRAGPVFLAGDAAHRVPPAGATGVGAAMHDAHNLVWKLAYVLKGHSAPGLLDTYAAEREPIGARNVTETAAAWARVWNPSGPPFAGRSLRQLDMGQHYRSAAVIPDGSPDADPPGADYVPTATPGCRAPHHRLPGGHSTIDLFDREFVLLLASAAGEQAAAAVRDRLAVPLSCRVIADPAWAAGYGISATGAVLVRPDGHVAWRRVAVGASPVAELTAALAQVSACHVADPLPG